LTLTFVSNINFYNKYIFIIIILFLVLLRGICLGIRLLSLGGEMNRIEKEGYRLPIQNFTLSEAQTVKGRVPVNAINCCSIFFLNG